MTSWIFQNYFLIALKFFYVIIIMKCFLHFIQSHQEVYCRHQGGSYVCEGICLPWGSISQDTWCEYRSNAANVFKHFQKLRFTCMNTATIFSCYFFFYEISAACCIKRLYESYTSTSRCPPLLYVQGKYFMIY